MHEIFMMVPHVRNEETSACHCPIDDSEILDGIIDVFEKFQSEA